MKRLELPPGLTVKVPAIGSKTPPVPIRVQRPPLCSPVIKSNKLIDVVLSLQTSSGTLATPALGCVLMVIVATLVASTQGATPGNLYSKVLVVAPMAGVKLPVAATKVPPVPPVRVQVPPVC